MYEGDIKEPEAGLESGTMSDERRLLDEMTKGGEPLTAAVEKGSYNDFQKPNMLKKIRQLKETYTICEVGGAVEQETKDGYEVVIVDNEGNAKAFNYIGLVDALGVKKNELPGFLERADYKRAPAKVGDYPGAQNPQAFFQELKIAA